MKTLHDDLLDSEVVQDPYTYFHRFSNEDPVHWNEQYEMWVLTKYEDVMKGFHDSRLSSERMKPSKKMEPTKAEELSSVYSILSKWMVFNDPPKHRRLRMLATKAFTPRAVEKSEPRISEITNYLLDQIRDKKDIDFIKDYAYILPIMVISEMLGVPIEDREMIKKWSDDLMLFVFATKESNRHNKAKNSVEEMANYLSKIIEKRRKDPKDDLITEIIQAGEQGDQLTNEEIVATCMLLVFGGHETTTNLLANGVYTLLKNEEQITKVKHDFSLMPLAIEEILRYEGPSKSMIRIAKEDLFIKGKKVYKGQRLLLVQASANRDPEKFIDGNSLNIIRNPNQHLAFGMGIHYCLGAPLARLEGQIGIEQVLRRFPSIHLASEDVEWIPSIISRGLKELNVQL